LFFLAEGRHIFWYGDQELQRLVMEWLMYWKGFLAAPVRDYSKYCPSSFLVELRKTIKTSVATATLKANILF
jgi:hypothetical protein